ncbi:MAG TPA: hypothetical protein VF820_01455 [Patescibacteria group bacterium]
MKNRLLYSGYIVTIILLFLYSYTQVDLGLTLSRVSIWQTIQRSFQYIGYFNRPLSGSLYLFILVLLFIFYGIFLYLSAQFKIKRRTVWEIICVTGFILLFSYSAFSYDIFNYIFDAKIVTHYFQNPYLHSALDFPKDPMLSFMHWTQRTYPYGPVWLLLTIPLSFIGLQFFLPTFFLFKALGVASYFLTIIYLEKILQRLKPKSAVFGLVLFALNPLVIIESLVSAHIDIAMIAFGVISLYSLLDNKNIRSSFLLILSIGVKFATGFLIPVYLFVLFLYKKNKPIPWNIVFVVSAILMGFAVVTEALRTNFQPWYFLIVMPFLALLGKKSYAIIPSFVLAFFFLLEYIPFLYKGDWNPPIPSQLTLLTISGIVVSAVVFLAWRVYTLVLQNK